MRLSCVLSCRRPAHLSLCSPETRQIAHLLSQRHPRICVQLFVCLFFAQHPLANERERKKRGIPRRCAVMPCALFFSIFPLGRAAFLAYLFAAFVDATAPTKGTTREDEKKSRLFQRAKKKKTAEPLEKAASVCLALLMGGKSVRKDVGAWASCRPPFFFSLSLALQKKKTNRRIDGNPAKGGKKKRASVRTARVGRR